MRRATDWGTQDGGVVSEPNYLERFATWLRDLGRDAEGLGALIEDEQLPEPMRRALIGAVNYVFKSLDLIPDGIDDIGYLDDAFVLRVSAELALQEELGDHAEPGAADKLAELQRLAAEADVVREFLDKDFSRLLEYVKGLRKGAARGRSGADIAKVPEVRVAFLQDLRSFCRAYEAPRFAQEEKSLVKLRAFFDAKLPK
jgi:uncharacterized membrane protein YkvA (DUF1232 family)